MNFKSKDILTNNQWSVKNYPFKYINETDVFTSEFYSALNTCYVEFMLSSFNKLKRIKNSNQFFPNGTYVFGLNSLVPEPFKVFFSAEWYSHIISFFPSTYTLDVNIAAHCRVKENTDTWIHNDLNPGWFPIEDSGSIIIADNSKCDYKTGKTFQDNIQVKKTVRSLAIIFYLNNPPTSEMEGGGTGLYLNLTQEIDNPTVTILPENNSILIFPCSPKSYHAFIPNVSHQRCAIVMWLHSPWDYIVSKFGENNIVYW